MRFSTMIAITIFLAIAGYFLLACGMKSIESHDKAQTAAITEALK